MIRKLIITRIGISNNQNLSSNLIASGPFFLLLAMTPENSKGLCHMVIQHFSDQKAAESNYLSHST